LVDLVAAVPSAIVRTFRLDGRTITLGQGQTSNNEPATQQFTLFQGRFFKFANKIAQFDPFFTPVYKFTHLYTPNFVNSLGVWAERDASGAATSALPDFD
jgi:hypothetical protein